jgi:hypothetical protein
VPTPRRDACDRVDGRRNDTHDVPLSVLELVFREIRTLAAPTRSSRAAPTSSNRPSPCQAGSGQVVPQLAAVGSRSWVAGL